MGLVASAIDFTVLRSSLNARRNSLAVGRRWPTLLVRLIWGDYEKVDVAQKCVWLSAGGVRVHQRNGRLVHGALSTGAVTARTCVESAGGEGRISQAGCAFRSW